LFSIHWQLFSEHLYWSDEAFLKEILMDYAIFCPQTGRPRHRNAAAPGLISLRSIIPAKAAYAATGIIFSLIILIKDAST
jgi:hypothetical protein